MALLVSWCPGAGGSCDSDCKTYDDNGYWDGRGALWGLSVVHSRLRFYRSMENRYPDNLEELVTARYIMPREILDPWGRQYWYERTPSGYELYSMGADELPKTADDVCDSILCGDSGLMGNREQ